MSKDLQNPNLFKRHEIVFSKETNHHFLFFPYTNKTILETVNIDGVSSNFSKFVEKSYVKDISINEEKMVSNQDSLKTGFYLIIAKEANSDNQCLIFTEQKLISLNDFTIGNETIQLPTVESHTFTNHLTNNFENVWKDNDGNTYRVKYSGEKKLSK
jgi:hypothetical protein